MRLDMATNVIPMGVLMGLLIIAMNFIHNVWVAAPFLILLGGLGGFLVVPMNALLQHRGHVLLSAGHSIAVQNFNENLSVLTMLMLYALMVKLNLNIHVVIVLFGLFVSGTMLLAMRKHAANQREHDSLALIGEHKH
jgi:MFS transporter, LPLT family, lysophospholipid transporter